MEDLPGSLSSSAGDMRTDMAHIFASPAGKKKMGASDTALSQQSGKNNV